MEIGVVGSMRDWIAKSQTNFFKFVADLFFRKKYDRRALVLETVAGVPGMVGGMLVHLRSLRKLQRGNGEMIHTLLAEAENERKHLMFMMEVVHPEWYERLIIIATQFIFWHYYLVMYLLCPKTAHRMVGYFEEEAVSSYTTYLNMIESGEIEDGPAPDIAIEYYKLLPDAKISDMVKYIRRDEMHHAKVNHGYANE